ncbi:MAG: hypothetical protein ACK4FP_02655 [Azonexus sp.]
MQSESFAPRILAAFLRASRRHFGLPPTPSSRRGQPADRLRPMLRSLALISSLGTALSQPAVAAETGDIPQTIPPFVTQEQSTP